MGNWRTARKRARRNRQQGRTLIVFNRGNWTWPGLHEDGLVVHLPYEREQPNAYRKYRS